MSFNSPLRSAATGEFPTGSTLESLSTNPSGSRLLGRVLAVYAQRQIAAGQFTGDKIVPGRVPKETVDSPSNLVAGKPPAPPKKSRKQEYRPGRRAGTLAGSPATVGSGKKTLLGA